MVNYPMNATTENNTSFASFLKLLLISCLLSSTQPSSVSGFCSHGATQQQPLRPLRMRIPFAAGAAPTSCTKILTLFASAPPSSHRDTEGEDSHEVTAVAESDKSDASAVTGIGQQLRGNMNTAWGFSSEPPLTTFWCWLARAQPEKSKTKLPRSSEVFVVVVVVVFSNVTGLSSTGVS